MKKLLLPIIIFIPLMFTFWMFVKDYEKYPVEKGHYEILIDPTGTKTVLKNREAKTNIEKPVNSIIVKEIKNSTATLLIGSRVVKVETGDHETTNIVKKGVIAYKGNFKVQMVKDDSIVIRMVVERDVRYGKLILCLVLVSFFTSQTIKIYVRAKRKKNLKSKAIN